MHTTNKAVDRYFQTPPDEYGKIYEVTKVDKDATKKNRELIF